MQCLADPPAGNTLPATPSTRMLNPGFLMYTASYDVASIAFFGRPYYQGAPSVSSECEPEAMARRGRLNDGNASFGMGPSLGSLGSLGTVILGSLGAMAAAAAAEVSRARAARYPRGREEEGRCSSSCFNFPRGECLEVHTGTAALPRDGAARAPPARGRCEQARGSVCRRVPRAPRV